MGKAKTESEILAEELMTKKKDRGAVKGLTLQLTMDDHDILDAISDFTDEKKGAIAKRTLCTTIRNIAMNLGLGEYNTKTMEFELYTEAELEAFKKEGK